MQSDGQNCLSLSGQLWKMCLHVYHGCTYCIPMQVHWVAEKTITPTLYFMYWVNRWHSSTRLGLAKVVTVYWYELSGKPSQVKLLSPTLWPSSIISVVPGMWFNSPKDDLLNPLKSGLWQRDKKVLCTRSWSQEVLDSSYVIETLTEVFN